MKISDAAGVRKQERKGDLARPCRGEDFLDDAQPFIGMNETIGTGQDPDMLGDSAGGHAEKDKCAGPSFGGHDFRHHLARTVCQHFSRPDLAPIPAVGRYGEWLVADNLAPNAAREAQTVTADTAQTGLIVVGRAEPIAGSGDNDCWIGGLHSTFPSWPPSLLA